jgi:hypothetical protein
MSQKEKTLKDGKDKKRKTHQRSQKWYKISSKNGMIIITDHLKQEHEIPAPDKLDIKIKLHNNEYGTFVATIIYNIHGQESTYTTGLHKHGLLDSYIIARFAAMSAVKVISPIHNNQRAKLIEKIHNFWKYDPIWQQIANETNKLGVIYQIMNE